MWVPMVDIGIVRVAVNAAGMDVDVGMRLVRRIIGSVTMAVVGVVRVAVLVRHRLVNMFVGVALGQVQVQA